MWNLFELNQYWARVKSLYLLFILHLVLKLKYVYFSQLLGEKDILSV